VEERNDKSKQEVNENLTMLLGQAWKQIELLRTLRIHVDARFDRIDERITELNKDVAEQGMAIREIKADVMGIKDEQDKQGQKLDQILQLLQLLQKGKD
jgi:uncharacterized coiled-coil protein SlyX